MRGSKANLGQGLPCSGRLLSRTRNVSEQAQEPQHTRQGFHTQTATQTSQLQPIPRKNIWCHAGSAALCLYVLQRASRRSGSVDTYNAKVTAYALYGAVEMIPVSNPSVSHLSMDMPLEANSHFTRTEAKNKLPQRLPNVTTGYAFSSNAHHIRLRTYR